MRKRPPLEKRTGGRKEKEARALRSCSKLRSELCGAQSCWHERDLTCLPYRARRCIGEKLSQARPCRQRAAAASTFLARVFKTAFDLAVAKRACLGLTHVFES